MNAGKTEKEAEKIGEKRLKELEKNLSVKEAYIALSDVCENDINHVMEIIDKFREYQNRIFTRANPDIKMFR